MRKWIGSIFQQMAWRLCDPHDDWAVDAENDSAIIHGPYSEARAWCKARPMGRILGCRASNISTGGADAAADAARKERA